MHDLVGCKSNIGKPFFFPDGGTGSFEQYEYDQMTDGFIPLSDLTTKSIFNLCGSRIRWNTETIRSINIYEKGFFNKKKKRKEEKTKQ